MRVLVLTSGTGGGHIARAKAFKAWAEELRQWSVEIYCALENTHSFYRFGVETYNLIQRCYPRLHHVYFNILELAHLHRFPRLILGSGRYLTALRDFSPDLIFSTHAHLNHGFFELARQEFADRPIRCVTYCGELSGQYGFSRHWVNPSADLFIGSVEDTSRFAVESGMSSTRTITGGFLLAPDFYRQPPDQDDCAMFIRQTLGFDPGMFTLLLATGPVGANNHVQYLRNL